MRYLVMGSERISRRNPRHMAESVFNAVADRVAGARAYRAWGTEFALTALRNLPGGAPSRGSAGSFEPSTEDMDAARDQLGRAVQAFMANLQSGFPEVIPWVYTYKYHTPGLHLPNIVVNAVNTLLTAGRNVKPYLDSDRLTPRDKYVIALMGITGYLTNSAEAKFYQVLVFDQTQTSADGEDWIPEAEWDDLSFDAGHLSFLELAANYQPFYFHEHADVLDKALPKKPSKKAVKSAADQYAKEVFGPLASYEDWYYATRGWEETYSKDALADAKDNARTEYEYAVDQAKEDGETPPTLAEWEAENGPWPWTNPPEAPQPPVFVAFALGTNAAVGGPDEVGAEGETEFPNPDLIQMNQQVHHIMGLTALTLRLLTTESEKCDDAELLMLTRAFTKTLNTLAQTPLGHDIPGRRKGKRMDWGADVSERVAGNMLSFITKDVEPCVAGQKSLFAGIRG